MMKICHFEQMVYGINNAKLQIILLLRHDIRSELLNYVIHSTKIDEMLDDLCSI